MADLETSLDRPGAPVSGARKLDIDWLMRGVGLNILLVVASGILASFMLPPREVWWFSWIYLIPLLIALRRTHAVRASWWLMLLFGLSFFTAALPWLTSIFGIAVVGIFIIAALPWTIFGPCYRVLAKSPRWWAVVLLAPVMWMALELVRCEGWYFQFSWAQFGFAFASCRRGGVLYPLIGVYGATYLIILVNVVMTEIWVRPQAWIRKLLATAALAGLILPLSLYMNEPIGNPNIAGDMSGRFRVALVQDESSSLDKLKELTLKLRAQRPRLIVWPEYSTIDYPLTNSAIMKQIQEVARTMNATLILGCKEHASDNARVDWLRRRAMSSTDGVLFYNSAIVISPSGELIGKYAKTHPIQFFSDGVPGRSYPTFPTPVGRVGIGICYDFDFAACPLLLARKGAEVMVVPTYDAREWMDMQHDQHARMVQARAAEVGRWTIRTTTSGVSQIINPRGQGDAVIWNGSSAASMGFATARRDMTPYTRATFILPYLCLGIFALWLAWVLFLFARNWRIRVSAKGKTSPV